MAVIGTNDTLDNNINDLHNLEKTLLLLCFVGGCLANFLFTNVIINLGSAYICLWKSANIEDTSCSLDLLSSDFNLNFSLLAPSIL